MIGMLPDRVVAKRSVEKAAGRGKTSTTTGRWQDKRAHIVRRSVGWFSGHFACAPHIVHAWHTVRCELRAADFRHFSHSVERFHGR